MSEMQETNLSEIMEQVKAREELPSGDYDRIDKRGKEIVIAQQRFCDEAAYEAADKREVSSNRVFIPIEGTPKE